MSNLNRLSVVMYLFYEKYKDCKQDIKQLYKLDLDAPNYCNTYYFGVDSNDIIIRAFSNQAEKEIQFSEFDTSLYKIYPKLIEPVTSISKPIETRLLLFALNDLKIFSLSIKDKEIYESIFKPIEDICDILS